ncbi:cupin domain-containing protein [Schlesneria paludicola]|uniref:cupin domain-containing protein n=1 Tax=Schlesneria paludicola TaxID=360056 RepID=UPI000299FB3D|nr:cupin domain-containing protein [Schlesneria paludicola]
MQIRNVFADLPEKLPDELFTTLLTATGLRIERIVSTGHASAADFWYEQEWHEFVLVVSGAARLRFANESQEHSLSQGDFLVIPAGERHSVEWTTPDEPTVWLAIHYQDATPGTAN